MESETNCNTKRQPVRHDHGGKTARRPSGRLPFVAMVVPNTVMGVAGSTPIFLEYSSRIDIMDIKGSAFHGGTTGVADGGDAAGRFIFVVWSSPAEAAAGRFLDGMGLWAEAVEGRCTRVDLSLSVDSASRLTEPGRWRTWGVLPASARQGES